MSCFVGQPTSGWPGGREVALDLAHALVVEHHRHAAGGLESAAPAREPTAEEVHPLFQRQREPTVDQFLELPLALGLERNQGLRSLATPGSRRFACAGHC